MGSRMATMRGVLFALVLVGCGSPEGRGEVASRLPDDQGMGGSESVPSEPTCQPVTCDAQVSPGALAYFTASGCSPDSRVLPIKANDPISGWTLCDGVGSWRTAGRVEVAGVWGGNECEDMSGMVDSFEWWAVVKVDGCR